MKKAVNEIVSNILASAIVSLIASVFATPAYNIIAWEFNFPEVRWYTMALLILAARFTFKAITGKIDCTMEDK